MLKEELKGDLEKLVSSVSVPANFVLTAGDIAFVLELASSAGRTAVAMRALATVEEKTSATDLVTSADKALSELLLAALSERYPGDLVLSEEAPWVAVAISDGRRRWIIDPIDGTKYYVDGSGKYAVMIGLEDKGRELFGCFFMPAHNQALFGGPGLGAYLYELKDGVATLSKVTAHGTMKDATMLAAKVRLMVSQNDLNAHGWLKALPDVEIVIASSIGIDVFELLNDEADLFVHIRPTLGYWDTAAPCAVAQGLGFEVGTECDDFISYGYQNSKHEPTIVIGKAGALAWWRRVWREQNKKPE